MTGSANAHFAEQGKLLAGRLHSAAVDLCCNKATEFSPDITKFFLLAAKVALLAYGPDASELERFERDVFYYQAIKPPRRTIVDEYERFKALHSRRNGQT